MTQIIKPASGARPAAITGICIIGLLGIVASIWLFVSGALDNAPGWFPPYFALSVVIGAVCMFGFWTMRKWSVYIYTAFLVVNQIVLFATQTWSPQSLILPLVVVIVGFMNLDKMR